MSEVRAVWGGAQSILGPRLVVPYRRSSEDGALEQTVYLSVLPAALDVEGSLRAEALSRGLFAVPVYDAGLVLRGHFEPVDAAALGLDGAELLWERAALLVEVSDPRSLGPESRASWDGSSVELLPGVPGAGDGRRGVHAAVAAQRDGNVAFEVALDMRGSEALWFVPFSRSTHVALSSDWPHPSFSGAWLPDRRTVQASGFSADWEVPHLGRDYAQSWTTSTDPYDQILESRFGVELLTGGPLPDVGAQHEVRAALPRADLRAPVALRHARRRAYPPRAVRARRGRDVHVLPARAVAERAPRLRACLHARRGRRLVLVSTYARAVLGSTGRGAVIASALSVLYGYLYTLLTLERYALLVGSLGLFTALAAVMYLTRWVDWHRVHRAARRRPAPAPDGAPAS